MKSLIRPIGVAAALLLTAAGAACAQDTAFRADLITATAIVESIDAETREVLLSGQTGSPFTVVAGPEVRNFDQIEEGDRVNIDFFETVAARIALPGTEGVAVEAVAGERAAEGQKPGAAVGMTRVVVVEFISYDPRTGIVTFIAPDTGLRAMVTRPEMRDFAAARQSGDQVEVTIQQAIAISVSPQPN